MDKPLPPPPPPTTVRRILALDPGASTGYAVIQIEGATATATATTAVITEYGFIDVDTKSSPHLGAWCLHLQQRLSELQSQVKATEIAVEDYFFSSRTCKGANVNPAYRTAIYMWAISNQLHYEILNISAWKLYISGRITPSREQKKQWGAKNAKKKMIVEALRIRHGITVPDDYSISEKTGRKIKFRHDCTDAIAQAMYASFLRYKIEKFTMEGRKN